MHITKLFKVAATVASQAMGTSVSFRRPLGSLISFCGLFGTLLLSVSIANASVIDAGFISFDGFIPGSVGLPGVNEFSINNLTGDPSVGGSALPTDFPIFSFLTFQSAQLSLIEPSGNEVFNLGDVGPGTILSDLVTASADISSATFTGTLDQTALTLSDGSTFLATSSSIQTTIQPSSGAFLNPGDFALITVSDEVTAVPEPGGLALFLFIPLLLCERLARKSHR